jgi:hypothetical protein
VTVAAAARPSGPAPTRASPAPAPAPAAGPPAPPPAAPAPARPLRFSVRVKNDPNGALKGSFSARLFPDALVLRRGKEPEIVLRPGIAAEYRGGNRLTLTIDGRPVEVAVVQMNLYQQRLARDLADFLSRRTPALDFHNYRIAWSLLIPAFAMLGIPALAGGNLLATAIAVFLALACLTIARRERLSKGVRLALSWNLVLGSYAMAIGLLVMAQLARPSWQPFTSAEGRYSVHFPGTAAISVQEGDPPVHQAEVRLPRLDMVFQVSYFDLPASDADPDQLLDTVCGRVLKEEVSHGTLAGQQPITSGTVAGRELRIDLPEEVVMVRRVFVSQPRVYFVTFVATRARADSAEARQFFDSFQLAPSAESAASSP